MNESIKQVAVPVLEIRGDAKTRSEIMEFNGFAAAMRGRDFKTYHQHYLVVAERGRILAEQIGQKGGVFKKIQNMALAFEKESAK